jgi:BirA family biotin operon repressor/biotin-[acetyl-CoA-carboxylase] ligase
MKYAIVKLLKDAAPGYVSGGDIGRRLDVSRTAVWKHVEELRKEGYSIEASTRCGYRLLPSGERLNAWEISCGLDTNIVGSEILYFDSLDSTNSYAGKLASEGCNEGLTVIAGKQTGGRGRLGRSWESPEEKGIYISAVIKPDMAPAESPILTFAAAVAVVDAMRKATGIKAGIKWPNDLIIDGKKVCGILLEMSSEADRVNYVIIGIGVNYSQDTGDFPAELKDKAVSLKMAAANGRFSRLSVIKAILSELDSALELIKGGFNKEILDAWREQSVTLGREVAFIMKDKGYCGMAVDITDEGRLLVDCRDGVRRELLSGEISIRGINGYI